MKQTHKQRLLNVARALMESPNPSHFEMGWYKHRCGTPACALGHYAWRIDLQRAFFLDNFRLCSAKQGEFGAPLTYDGVEVCRHFGITALEAKKLFSDDGCGDARTAEAAAQYIVDFVARKEGASVVS